MPGLQFGPILANGGLDPGLASFTLSVSWPKSGLVVM
jgi:hypothetical protein